MGAPRGAEPSSLTFCPGRQCSACQRRAGRASLGKTCPGRGVWHHFHQISHHHCHHSLFRPTSTHPRVFWRHDWRGNAMFFVFANLAPSRPRALARPRDAMNERVVLALVCRRYTLPYASPKPQRSKRGLRLFYSINEYVLVRFPRFTTHPCDPPRRIYGLPWPQGTQRLHCNTQHAT